MPIDISQFHEGFFDEAEEHIARLEALLLELDLKRPDAEKLNAIFRAAHSIKGGSGTFGLSAMKDFTHVLETLLDRVRHGELKPTKKIIDVCLEAGDVLREMVQRYRAKEPEDTRHADKVAAKLHALASTISSPREEEPEEPVHAHARTFHVEFTSQLQGSRRHDAYDGIVSALKSLGTVRVDNEQHATEQTWNFSVGTTHSADEIRDLFDFITVEGDALTVDAQTAEPEVPAAAIDEGFGFFDDAPGAPLAKPDQGYGFFEDAPGAPRIVDGVVIPERRRRFDESSSSIRVNLKKVDQMINLVGEMVIAQSKVAQLIDSLDPATYQMLHDAAAVMQRNSRDLQDSIMSTRMMPIKTVFSRFPRMVRELADALGKDVSLTLEGEDTELDKGLLEQIADPLTHLVRNSIDHGIETTQARIALGKRSAGAITLRASHRGGNIVIEVMDDGGGLNRDKIVRKARERGIAIGEGVPDHEIWQLIFAPGFSTSDVVTDVSGRGVGMDVVKRNIDSLGGRIEIESMAGLGTHLTIHLPLTLAILDGLSVGVGHDVYILPLPYIIESIQGQEAEIKTISGRGEVMLFRGEYVPLLWLSDVFHIERASQTADQGILVVIESSGRKAALVVDSLESQHQVVVKSLATNFRRVPGISGATILGNGRVTLILDVPGLLHMHQPKGAATMLLHA